MEGPYRPLPTKVYMNGEILMAFKAPGYQNIPDQTVVLSFHNPTDSGDMTITEKWNGTVKTYKLYNIAYVKFGVSTWKNFNNDPNRAFILKRANTIAQALIDKQGHPTAPADGPGGGFSMSGSYVLGASWGDLVDTNDDYLDGVALYPGYQWNETLTYREGSYPGYPYVQTFIQNSYFWEPSINLRTRP